MNEVSATGLPSIAQIIMILLGCASTGLLGVLVFIFNRAVARFNDLEKNVAENGKAHGATLTIISSIQEQVRTLFRVQDEHREDIVVIENRLNNSGWRGNLQ